MSEDNFVDAWLQLEDHTLSGEHRAAFAESISFIYDTPVDPNSPGPDLDGVVNECLEMAAFMITYFQGRTKETPDLPALWSRYVMTAGRVIVPQTRYHFLLQLMISCSMMLYLDDECKGPDRERLVTIHLPEDGEPRAETNKEVEHTEDWHRTIGTLVLPAEHVLDALVDTGLEERLSFTALCTFEAMAADDARWRDADASLAEELSEVLEGYEPSWKADKTFTAIMDSVSSSSEDSLTHKDIAVYTAAMWVMLMVV